MARPVYKVEDIERAHTWIAKAIDALEEARTLIPSGRTRMGAYSRLYYAAHHTAVALLRLIGISAKSHKAVVAQFGKEWVKNRMIPSSYGKLLHSLAEDRIKADYGEYVPTMQIDLERRLKVVELFVRRASREIPPVSTAKILSLLVQENPDIFDFSFDIYCPKSYHHHTRFTAWCPKGRLTDRWLGTLLHSIIRTLTALHIKEAKHYVVGLNSRANQYQNKHIIMLDFDNVSSVPYNRLKGEPGFFFRTHSGFHFIGSHLYDYNEWKKRMRIYSRIASKQHFEMSMKRGYATLRLTASPRKPVTPAYVGRAQ